MFPVLLMILKIAGIVILALTGLLLLIMLVIFLVPVRYGVSGSYYGKPEGRITVTWLLHGVSLVAVYEDGLDVVLRVLGKQVFRIGKEETEEKEKIADALKEEALEAGEEMKGRLKEEIREADGSTGGRLKEDIREADDGSGGRLKGENREADGGIGGRLKRDIRETDGGIGCCPEEEEDEAGGRSRAGEKIQEDKISGPAGEVPQVDFVETADKNERRDELRKPEEADEYRGGFGRPEEADADEYKGGLGRPEEADADEYKGGLGRPEEKDEWEDSEEFSDWEKENDSLGWWKKDKSRGQSGSKKGGRKKKVSDTDSSEPGISEKLKHLEEAVKDRWNGFQEKKERLLSFLNDEENQRMFRVVFRQIRALIRHILPRKVQGKAVFGFEDPATTGKILSALSVAYVWYGDRIEIVPVFDRKILEVEGSLKGRVSAGVVAARGVRVLLNKNFRRLVFGRRKKNGGRRKHGRN